MDDVGTEDGERETSTLKVNVSELELQLPSQHPQWVIPEVIPVVYP